MKNIENMNALNDMAVEMVAGGDGLPTIYNPGTPLALGQKKDQISDPANHFYPPLGRPLPFPQDRKGNKAPFGMNSSPYAPIRKSQGLPDNPLTDTPDFPFC